MYSDDDDCRVTNQARRKQTPSKTHKPNKPTKSPSRAPRRQSSWTVALRAAHKGHSTAFTYQETTYYRRAGHKGRGFIYSKTKLALPKKKKA